VIGWEKPGRHYEVLANHMTWNNSFIEEAFKPNVTKITILRHPGRI
jgi:hypothetical protein